MKIKKSKNLMYTKIPLEYFEVAERVEPAKCILASFTSPDDKIEAKLENFIGKSYEEILNADF